MCKLVDEATITSQAASVEVVEALPYLEPTKSIKMHFPRLNNLCVSQSEFTFRSRPHWNSWRSSDSIDRSGCHRFEI